RLRHVQAIRHAHRPEYHLPWQLHRVVVATPPQHRAQVRVAAQLDMSAREPPGNLDGQRSAMQAVPATHDIARHPVDGQGRPRLFNRQAFHAPSPPFPALLRCTTPTCRAPAAPSAPATLPPAAAPGNAAATASASSPGAPAVHGTPGHRGTP